MKEAVLLEAELKEINQRVKYNKLKSFMMFVFIIFEIAIMVLFLVKKDFIPSEPRGDKIAVINIDQEITVDYSHKIMQMFEKVKDKDSYKGFLVLMNSPGGSPAASEELSEYLKTLNKPVTMYIESMAASGGYYIASAVKPLYANKNAIVGSIGVIMPHYNIKSFAEKVGIEEDYLSAGEFKKPVSIFKPIDQYNKDYLTQNMITPMYENFLNSVAKNRGIEVEKIASFAEGKIFLANNPEIQDILVDEVTSLERLKEKMRNKKDLHFIDVSSEQPSMFPALGVKFDLDFSSIKNQIKDIK